MGRFRMHILFVAMGLSTMVAQIVIMRRCIVVFGGNELVSGAVFAGWLGWSGVGNIIAGRFADRIRDAGRAAAISLFAMALAIPLTVAAATLVKASLRIPPPVMAGLPLVVAATLALMAPLGFLIGASFTIACRIPATGRASDIGRVWALDAIGAGIGGIAFSLAAVRYFSPIQASCITAAVLIAAAGIAFRRREIEAAALALVAMLALALWSGNAIDFGLASIQWRGFNPVAQKESLFASLMVTDNRSERTMFVDGRPSFSLPLPETYETVAHLPLTQHPDPRDVLIVGGGISGMIDRWRQWNLGSAHFARLDGDETRLERDEMPSDIDPLPRWASIHHADGRRLIKEGFDGCGESCLDVIIINVGDPDTAAADRYFTVEFFREAKRMLREKGVLAIGLLEPANVIGEEQARILGTIRASIGEVFPYVAVLPFERFYFLASADGGYLTDDLDQLDRRIESRGISAEFFRSRTLAGIYQERVSSFRKHIEMASHDAKLNTDLKPMAYHAGMMLWEARAGSLEGGFLANLSRIKWWVGAVLVAVAVAASILFRKRAPARTRASWVLTSLGFASIVYEIVLIVHYQMSEGLLVWRIGLIMTAFMVGAGLGAFAAIRWLGRRRASNRTIILMLVLFALYMPLQFVIAKASFLFANFMMGVICGWIYQLMASQMVGDGRGVGRAAGIIESADHWGAAAGALAASLIAIPLAGLSASLFMASAVLVAAAIVAALVRS